MIDLREYYDIPLGTLIYDKNEPKFSTFYFPSTDFDLIHADVSYTDLIYFMNNDFSNLRILARDLLALLVAEKISGNSIKTAYENFCHELIRIHPFFTYHLYLNACNTLSNFLCDIYNNSPELKLGGFDPGFHISRLYKVIFSLYDIAPCSRDTIMKSISIYNPLNTSLAFTSKSECGNQSISMINAEDFDDVANDKFVPFLEIELFRNYLAEKMPRNQYNAKSLSEWDKFFKDFKLRYEVTETIPCDSLKEDFVENQKLENRIIQSAFGSDASTNTSPAKKIVYAHTHAFKIYSFPQYIFTQLSCIRWNKYSIKFCYVCGLYYSDSPFFQRHACLDKKYYKNMCHLKNAALQRIKNKHASNRTDEDIKLFEEFHKEMWHNALLIGMCEEEYEQYT